MAALISAVGVVVEHLKEPMTVMLIIAAIISGVTTYYSNDSFAAVITILIVVFVSVVLGVFTSIFKKK